MRLGSQACSPGASGTWSMSIFTCGKNRMMLSNGLSTHSRTSYLGGPSSAEKGRLELFRALFRIVHEVTLVADKIA